MKTVLIAFIAFLSLLSAARADEAQVASELKAKGAKITETKGVITGIEVPKPTEWSDDDIKKINGLPHLQRLGFGLGFTDHQLSLLNGLSEVTNVGTNGANFTDVGIKAFTQFKKLQGIAFFHPGKSLTGTGLAALAELPDFGNLTVGGTYAFGNDGVAAIATLPHMKSLRIGHTGADVEGISKLKQLAGLTSISIGQHLSYTPPVASLSEATIPVLLSMKSLESISLSEAKFSLNTLRQLKDLPKLKHLILDAVIISETDLAELRKELPNVQIKYTPPGDANLKRLKALFP